MYREETLRMVKLVALATAIFVLGFLCGTTAKLVSTENSLDSPGVDLALKTSIQVVPQTTPQVVIVEPINEPISIKEDVIKPEKTHGAVEKKEVPGLAFQESAVIKAEETHGTVVEKESPSMVFQEPNALKPETLTEDAEVIGAEPEPIIRKKEAMF